MNYPTGKSAMVFYFYAANDARAALKRLFDDEINESGAQGQGPLWFRFLEHPHAEAHLSRLFDDFMMRFGSAPVLGVPISCYVRVVIYPYTPSNFSEEK